MGGDARAAALAQLAADLATGARIELPDSLRLWRLAGGRPTGAARRDDDPAWVLATALEPLLDATERRRGAHHTPRVVAARVAEMALAGSPSSADAAGSPSVVDPACGAGALLLAAADRLVAFGQRRDEVARSWLWGADLDPLAVAVAEAAISLWSGGVAPAAGHLAVGDTLRSGLRAWPRRPDGFAALVANPPFQGQLGRGTVRSHAETAGLRDRFGLAVAPYVDTAALFLLAGTDLVRAGGTMAIIVPQSVVAARDAAPVRRAVSGRATLRELWEPAGRAFEADVNVVVAAFDVGSGCGDVDWARHLASQRGVPDVDLDVGSTVGDLASAVAGFRDEYYGLVGHVREAAGASTAPLVTSGCIDVGDCAWGERPVRFAKQRWARPEVDLAGLRAADGRLAGWVDRLRRPKVVVASQTRVVEAAVDATGDWIPVTPVVSVLPDGATDPWRVAAALCSPPVAAWAARRAAGTALSPGAIRVSAALLLAAPLPADRGAWTDAAAALQRQDLERFARAATTMYRLPPAVADEVRSWWTARLPARQRSRGQD